jgi:hypothetical protein
MRLRPERTAMKMIKAMIHKGVRVKTKPKKAKNAVNNALSTDGRGGEYTLATRFLEKEAPAA